MQQLKRLGHLISIISVFLLAASSWAREKDDRTLLFCLVGGVAMSIVGMGMRWVSYEAEQRQKRRTKQERARSSGVKGKAGIVAT